MDDVERRRNLALVDQFLGWALVPLYRVLDPTAQEVFLRVNLLTGVVTQAHQPLASSIDRAARIPVKVKKIKRHRK